MNTVLPRYPEVPDPCPVVDDAARIAEGYSRYFTDESRLAGKPPSRIYFPESTEQVSAAVRDVAARGERLTVSAGRTGIVGGAVPNAPNLLCLERLTGEARLRWDDNRRRPLIRVPAGMQLGELNESLRAGRWEKPEGYAYEREPAYPVDLTELSATIGGTVATNGSGARSLRYGPTRNWVSALTVVLADGGIVDIERGRLSLSDGILHVERESGMPETFTIEGLPIPRTKHAAGYFLATDMDVLDLFVGSEGTLGIVTSAELALMESPAQRLSLVAFLPEDEPAELVLALKRLGASAIEYMDRNSVELLAKSRKDGTDGGHVPEFPEGTQAILYIEMEAGDEQELEQAVAEVESTLAHFHVSADSTWAGFEPADTEAMKRFRHTLPERVNAIIAERKREIPGLTKIGTDMAVPDSELAGMHELYRSSLESEGFEYCMFGHIGDAHIHVNILPRSMEERRRGYELYRTFASKAVEVGGSVSAEHGIGRLKRELLEIQFGAEHLAEMRRVKRFLDPQYRLNPGVLFDPESS